MDQQGNNQSQPGGQFQSGDQFQPSPPATAAASGNEAAEDRFLRGARVTWITMGGNVVIAAAKAVLALMTGSIALMADAFHTASDIVTSIVVMIGLRVGRRPPDAQHPQGHGRAETIAALIVGVLLAVVGIEFFMAAMRRLAGAEAAFGEEQGALGLWLIAAIVLVTAVAKEAMARYTIHIGRQIDSAALAVDAWHHRTDALSSLPVAASLIAARYGYYRVDAAVGLGVSVLIVYTAWTFIHAAWSKLLGEAPHEDVLRQIQRIAEETHGVKNAHDVTVHDYGTRQMTSVHITLDAGLTIEHAHHVATAVESALAARMGMSALVHIEPDQCELLTPVPVDLREQVREILLRHPRIVSFHALHLHVEDHGTELELNLHIEPGTTIEESHHLEHEVMAMLEEKFPDLHVHLHVEPCNLKCNPCPGTCRPE